MTGSTVLAVERACAELTGAAPAETVRVRPGPKTAVYRVRLADGRPVVVKLFAADTTHGAADEARLLAAVAAAGRVRVPAVIGYGPVPGLAVSALVTADAGTSTLGDAVRVGQMPRPAALLRLALLMAAFHSTKAPAGVPWHRASASRSAPWPPTAPNRSSSGSRPLWIQPRHGSCVPAASPCGRRIPRVRGRGCS